jgi:predicted CXXCH cytochrome family protein
VVRSQEQCADCHRDVKQVAAQATSDNVVDFHSGHPAFRISLSDAATPNVVRRVRQATPMPADMVERSRLKFNHQVHLDPNGVRDPDGKRNPAGMHDAQGQRTVLDCQSCHVPADGGRLMAPVKMEQHCQSCHSLAFEPSVTSRQVVHGEDAQIATMLREFYARLVLGDVPEGVTPPDDLPRLRPGAVLTSEDRSRALAIADRKSKQVLHELFDTRQVCSTCHEVSRKGEFSWSVASVKMSSSWMPQAQFSHAAHDSEPCAKCHDVARSKHSKDVAMPAIETCRECHVGAQPVAGKVTSDCATCHGYHGAVKASVKGLVAGTASAQSTARVAHTHHSFKEIP